MTNCVNLMKLVLGPRLTLLPYAVSLQKNEHYQVYALKLTNDCKGLHLWAKPRKE